MRARMIHDTYWSPDMRDLLEQLVLVGLVVVCALIAWADLTDQFKSCAPVQKVPAQQWRQV